jgi:2-phosphoglycerate kinase
MYTFIAGATGVGKTTLASLLSRELRCHVLRTTDVREVLRTVIPECTLPSFFRSTYELQDLADNSFAKQFNDQAVPILAAIGSVLNRRYGSEQDHVIVEGVHLLPSILRHLRCRSYLVLLIPQPSVEEHWRRLATRAGHNDKKPLSRYRDNFRTLREIGALVEENWLSCNLGSRLHLVSSFPSAARFAMMANRNRDSAADPRLPTNSGSVS